ncbi:MAG: hypothetical protein U9N49_01080 [Campylobacterota bacterium]|nr:hypothetical protein [Campylobacterota bacterium]
MKNKIKILYNEKINSLKWSTIRSLGESKIVRSSYYWIFFLPLVAKLLENIDNPLKLTIFEYTFPLNIELPFSWYLLYFSAIFFAFGVLLYTIYCPKLISKFENFKEYYEQGGEGFQLEDEIEKNIPKNIIDNNSAIFEAYQETLSRVGQTSKNFNSQSPDSIIKKELRRIKPEELFNLFYTIRTVVDNTHPFMARLSIFSFVVGLLLFASVLLQNLWFIISQLI